MSKTIRKESKFDILHLSLLGLALALWIQFFKGVFLDSVDLLLITTFFIGFAIFAGLVVEILVRLEIVKSSKFRLIAKYKHPLSFKIMYAAFVLYAILIVSSFFSFKFYFLNQNSFAFVLVELLCVFVLSIQYFENKFDKTND